MLAVLMYHRVTHTSFVVDDHAFENHLSYLAKQYHIVLPGDALNQYRMNICLTFDDAYFDFYHKVFPILQHLQIPAVLAIPAGLILDNTNLSQENRLQVPYDKALSLYQSHASLCTWEEIKTMIATNLVMPAAHGLMHQKIRLSNLKEEVLDAKQLLKEKTQKDIASFVYPYGTMEKSINDVIRQHYQYTMRIGSAMNINWQNYSKVIYRFNADDFWVPNKPLFTKGHNLTLWTRFLSNTLRGR